jgi:aspartyl-tRNA(Asn)/glutamyl-tRNA(Gln) amidotransferase subunit C
MSLSDDQVRRIARLARIAIRPEELAAVQARLNRVLDLVDEMRRVDTSGVEPMAHPLDAVLAAEQRLREDEVTERGVHDGLYFVPRVIE